MNRLRAAVHQPLLITAFVSLLVAAPALAQCAVTYDSLATPLATDDLVQAARVWDRDGAGPLPPVVVFGGRFVVCGDAAASGVVQSDLATGHCAPIGSGSGIDAGEVTALGEVGNHELVIGGSFTAIDGVPCNHVARWDGTSWQPFGAGVPFPVRALATLPNGDLIAGGITNGDPIRRWDGSSWQTIGSGLVGAVLALAVLPGGQLVAGGAALLATGPNIAVWDGVAWSPVGGGTDQSVAALQVSPTGELFAAGLFQHAGGVAASAVARFDGTSWSPLGAGVQYDGRTLALAANGDLVVGGTFPTAGGVTSRLVARWNGSAWQAMSGLGGGEVDALASLPNGDLVAAGFLDTPFSPATHLARWQGAAWVPWRTGTEGPVQVSITMADGDLVVGGLFTWFEGIPANRVVRRHAGVWQALGGGVDGSAFALLELPNGDLVVAGDFAHAGGVPATRVARWDGSAWHAMAGGLPGIVRHLSRAPGGQILARGDFDQLVMVWDGTTWNGTGIDNSSAWHMYLDVPFVTLPDGDVLTVVGLPVQQRRWDGQTWTPVGPATTGAGLARNHAGDVFLGGNALRRWNGTTWSTLVTVAGSIQSIVVLPDDQLLLGGSFSVSGATPIVSLARWDGTALHPVGSRNHGPIRELRWQADGQVFAAGGFFLLDGVATAGFGTLHAGCPAAAVAAGNGCTGSGGANVLTATELPWIGGEYLATATGMPANGLALDVLGLTPVSVPLASILQQGAPGCLLLTAPDLLDAHLPLGGVVSTRRAIPASPTLVGQTLYQQVVALELDISGAILSVTGTNRLALTVGSFF